MPAYSPYLEFFDHSPIAAGDFIYLSSDLRRLIYQSKKHKETFDPQRFIDALKQKLTGTGTIIIPTFNYTLKNKDVFDIRHTLPITGTLSVEVLKDKEFARTSNPLHSFAVWGKLKNELLALENRSSFGEDSPFHIMDQQNGKLVAIDVDLQQSLTFAHYVEESVKVAYRKNKIYTINYTDAQGVSSQKQFSIYAKKKGYVNQVNPLLDDFRKAGIIKEFNVNQVSCFVLDLHASFDIMKHDLLNNGAGKMTYFNRTVFFKSLIKSLLRK